MCVWIMNVLFREPLWSGVLFLFLDSSLQRVQGSWFLRSWAVPMRLSLIPSPSPYSSSSEMSCRWTRRSDPQRRRFRGGRQSSPSSQPRWGVTDTLGQVAVQQFQWSPYTEPTCGRGGSADSYAFMLCWLCLLLAFPYQYNYSVKEMGI